MRGLGITNADEQQFRIFERKNLRKIFGPGQSEDRSWSIRTNYELDQLIHDADVEDSFGSSRVEDLEWLDHARRMNDSEQPKESQTRNQ